MKSFERTTPNVHNNTLWIPILSGLIIDHGKQHQHLEVKDDDNKERGWWHSPTVPTVVCIYPRTDTSSFTLSMGICIFCNKVFLSSCHSPSKCARQPHGCLALLRPRLRCGDITLQVVVVFSPPFKCPPLTWARFGWYQLGGILTNSFLCCDPFFD